MTDAGAPPSAAIRRVWRRDSDRCARRATQTLATWRARGRREAPPSDPEPDLLEGVELRLRPGRKRGSSCSSRRGSDGASSWRLRHSPSLPATPTAIASNPRSCPTSCAPAEREAQLDPAGHLGGHTGELLETGAGHAQIVHEPLQRGVVAVDLSVDALQLGLGYGAGQAGRQPTAALRGGQVVVEVGRGSRRRSSSLLDATDGPLSLSASYCSGFFTLADFDGICPPDMTLRPSLTR